MAEFYVSEEERFSELYGGTVDAGEHAECAAREEGTKAFGIAEYDIGNPEFEFLQLFFQCGGMISVFLSLCKSVSVFC